jgi:hypothetical protein
MVVGLTRQLVKFIASISFACHPAAFVEAVKRGAIESIRVVLAARDEGHT